MIAWLWDAPGPDRSGLGVSGDEGSAKRAAADVLRTGCADVAQVEAAAVTVETDALSCGYRRTGSGWTARLGPRGGIRWMPLAPRADTR